LGDEVGCRDGVNGVVARVEVEEADPVAISEMRPGKDEGIKLGKWYMFAVDESR
jgi:hypothetical protein